MKAIQIKCLPATNFKGARMKAFTKDKNSITVPFKYEISNDQARAEDVAQELINRLDWKVTISGMGCLPNGDYVATIK